MKRTFPGGTTRPVGNETVAEPASSGDETEEMDTPDENPAKYCRLCFSIAQPLEPVFSGPNDEGGVLAQLIRESMAVPLIAREDYPCAICKECLQRLHEFQRFRQLFHKLNRVVCRKRNAQSMTSKQNGVVDSTTNGNGKSSKDCIELSDDEEDNRPVVSNGPSAETAEDVDDDGPYIALEDDWFCCRLCNRMFQTLTVMMDHFRMNHPGTVQVYDMPASKANIAIPNMMHEVTNNGVRFFKCNECDTMLRQKGNMIKHWTKFHKEGAQKKLHCKVPGCSRFFMDVKSYRRHLTIQHGISDPSKIVKYQMQTHFT